MEPLIRCTQIFTTMYKEEIENFTKKFIIEEIMINKIYINKEDELTVRRLTKIIRYHREKILPEMLFNRGYYDGIGQRIMKREYEDPTKPNNRIVKNYCKSTVENFRGYMGRRP